MKPLQAAFTAFLIFCPLLAKCEEIRVPVSRDTWVSAVGEEATANLGGSSRLKLKSIQEMTLVDIDPTPLRGRVITRATLHVRLADKERLRRVTVSTVSAEWDEGTSPSYAPGAPGASFRFRKNPDAAWSTPGSDITSVVLGFGSSRWKMADASEPDADGWQTIPVDPLVVAARVAGLSHGFLVFDDTGSEWTYDGSKYEHRLFPNRFVYSREAGLDKAPYFTVELGPEDHEPPQAIAEVKTDGEAFYFDAPRDAGPGPAHILGFKVQVNGKELPQWLTPRGELPGDFVQGWVPDEDLATENQAQVKIAAVDMAGNAAPWYEYELKVSPKPKPDRAKLLASTAAPFQESDEPPPVKLGDQGEIFVVDELDTFTATGQARTGPRPKLYTQANHLWQARQKQVRLHAARNEFVAFQVLIAGTDRVLDTTNARLSFADKQSAGIQVELGRLIEVPTADGTWVGDPVVPLSQTKSWPEVPGRTMRSLHVELYVPHDTPPGKHSGVLTLEAGGAKVDLALDLNVWDFTLGDGLNFLAEMNCYDLPVNERDYYRLAHKHRTFINRVPYHQNGQIAEGCAPRWDGKTLDWTDWDKRFGPLFDGSAFADLPRKGMPIPGFYLPIHENWPTPIEGNYNGNYWADLAFTPEYRAALVEVSRQLALHLKEKKWQSTIFQGFLNGKNDFKKNGWNRGSSPWLLDEPANFQDFWALRWFGQAMGEGFRAVPYRIVFDASGSICPRLAYRVDISRPQWQRDSLQDATYVVISGDAARQYSELQRTAGRQRQFLIEYGAANSVGTANHQAVAWCLDAWSRGLNGVLPWQTIGTRNSWSRADDLALFYPGQKQDDAPVPSIRLKAFRRGQQDVEIMNLLHEQISADAIQKHVRTTLDLDARREKSGPEAEATSRMLYDRVDPIALWKLRLQCASLLAGNPRLKHASNTGMYWYDMRPFGPQPGDSSYVPGSTATGQSGFVGAKQQALKSIVVPGVEAHNSP